MNTQAVSSLAAKLVSDVEAVLTPEEKQLLVDVLASVVMSQDVIARQARLLKSYQHDVEVADASTIATLSRFTQRAHAPRASAAYDLAKARAARESLLAEVRRAESLEGVIAQVLKFAAVVATIAA